MSQSFEQTDGFLDFMDMLTAYRKTRVLMCAHELGVFEALVHGAHSDEDICSMTGMDHTYGARLIEVLVQMRFLERTNDKISLTDFSKRFLIKGAPLYQGVSLDFEKTLIKSWQHLSETLLQGKRIFQAEDKSQEEYQASLSRYLGAMDNAALIRAGELWSKISPLKHKGTLVDAGAGSGAFLQSFLLRNPKCRGVFVDLPDVVSMAQANPGLDHVKDRIDFLAMNFLDEADTLSHQSADILLCSNLVHCQGDEETRALLSKLVPGVSPSGCMIIHDFYTDTGHRGALYDLHMMLNTYNGRTYHSDEVRAMMRPLGFNHDWSLSLESGSEALVFSRSAFEPGFFV